MSNLSKPKVQREPIFYTVVPDGDMREKVFEVFPDGSFKELDILYIRIDTVMETPLSLLVNDKEWSVTINNNMGILFRDEFCVEEFLDEIFFAMEEVHGLDEKIRTTKPDKIITDLPTMLEFKLLGEIDGEKELDDRQDK